MLLSENQPAPIIPNVDYSAGWTLVYFYPKDFTPGCTTEACSFRDNFSELSSHLNIIGISQDSEASHQKFKDHYQLPYTLISDTDKELAKAFGADGLILPKRVSFLINPSGQIAKIYPKVDVKTHAQEILADLNTYI